MITRKTWFNLALAGIIVAVAAGLTYARKIGLVESDVPMRATMIMVGLQMAFYGNMAPKWAATAGPRTRAVQRVAGWLFVISGLANAAIWAFVSPMDVAAALSMIPVAGAMVAVFGYCAWTRLAARAG